MKQLFLVQALLLLALIVCYDAEGQPDSTFHYRMATGNFYDDIDVAIDQQIINHPNDTSEGGPLNQLYRTRDIAGPRISNDVSVGTNLMKPYSTVLKTMGSNIMDYCLSGNAWKGNWKNIGPFNSNFGQTNWETNGRFNAVWASPANVNIILAASDGGGLWKSTDGGATWFNLTDAASTNASNLALLGASFLRYMVVDPLDEDRIYLVVHKDPWYTSKSGGQYFDLGLIYSEDGGQTWNLDNGLSVATGRDFPAINRIAFKPGTSELYLSVENKLYRKSNAQASWAMILNAGEWGVDFDFGKLNTNKIIASSIYYDHGGGTISPTRLWESNNNGATWASKDIIISGYTMENNGGIQHLSLSGTDVPYMYIHARDANNQERFLLAKTGMLATDPIVIRNSNLSRNLNDIIVSPTDHNVIYSQIHNADQNGASDALLQSTDEGASFNPITTGHADGRGLYVYSTALTPANRGINDVLFYASDGGVCKKNSGDASAHSITGDNLCVTQFYGFGGTEAAEHLLMGGTQDNGSFLYNAQQPNQWNNIAGGDGYTAKFRRNGDLTAYGESNTPGMFGRNLNVTPAQHIFLPHPIDVSPPTNRLQYFDPQNTAHVAYNHLWQMPLNSNTWSFRWQTGGGSATDPFATITGFESEHVADLFISERGDNIAYMAYRNPAGTDPTGPGNPSGKLFKTTDGGVTWENITPAVCSTLGINAIAVDPKNSDRLWVGLANLQAAEATTLPANITKRVYYSANGGQNWQEMSKGLSPLPVNKLVYRQGSDDDLYAGTDAGVYRWNKTLQQWECFRNGLPPCIVMDMEFNYCAGKLRVATFGRGIWETNILVDPFPANNPPTFADEFRPIPEEVITGNTTWNSDKYIYTGIRITNGATLTIENNGSDTTVIHMPKNGVILVEKGGTLIVDGARITNSCEDCMWAGISVQGTNHAPQTLIYQGKLSLKNGTVLEHARVAVGNSFIDDPNRYNNTGGIIQAAHTAFLNNGRAVEFLAYNDLSTLNDQSFFRNCRFEINDAYKGAFVGYPFEHHVTLWDVHGVEFNGCAFVNNHTTSQKNKGDGVYAYNAGFYARPYILGGSQPGNRFDSLKHGIVADGDMYGWPVSTIIDRNSFSANSVGLKIINIPHVSAIRNTFTVGNGKGIDLFDCRDNIGIYTQNTPQFRIEENTFNGATGAAKIADNSVGALIYNSGKNDKELYKNSFTNLDFGVFAQGNNTSYIAKLPKNQTGLRILCNTFTANDYDINVTGDPLKQEGISYFQGYYTVVAGTPKVLSAGNSFMTPTATHIHNTASNFNYFHYNSVSVPANVVGPVGVFVANGANECASKLSTVTEPDAPVELTSGGKATMKALFWDSKSQRDSKQSTCSGLMNAGRPEQEVVDEVTMMTDIDAYNLLSGYSPYVSWEVLKAVATQGIMDNSMLKDLLAANPDVIRDVTALTYLASDEVPDPFDEGDMNDLSVYMQEETPRTRLEAEISFHQANMSHAVNMLLTDIKCREEVTEADSVVVWLDRTGELWADYQKAYYWLAKGENAIALDIIEDQILVDHAPAGAELMEHTALGNILNILVEVNEDERTIFELDSTERATLSVILDLNLPNASSLATSVLTQTGYHVRPCIDLPISSSRMPVQKGRSAIRKKASAFNVYPNPASEYVIFEYKLENDADPILITVTNTVGQQAGSFELKANATGKYYWDIRHLPAGNYFYKANNNKKDYGSGKIVVVR